MSYNFKKISELELIDEVPEGANVLIETDGATKRLPTSAIKPAGGGNVIAYTYMYGNGHLYKDPGCETVYTRDELLALGTSFSILVEGSRLFAPLYVKDYGDYAEVAIWATSGGSIMYTTVEYVSAGPS